MTGARAAWAGAAVIAAYCIAAVALRGVQWDESCEHAQALTGAVAYPEGHPLPRYLAQAFSAQTLVSAAMLDAGATAAWACGTRNAIFLLMTLLPVYALAWALTRSAACALAAAALILHGILLEFEGSYPSMVWPGLYSNGHIGTGFAVLAFAAWLIRPGCGGMLLGLMPAVHAGQLPLPWAAAALDALRGMPRRALRRAAVAFGAGLTASLACYAAYRLLYAPAGGGAAAWPALGEAEALWRSYTAYYDPHRAAPPGNGIGMLCGALLLALLGARQAEGAGRRPWRAAAGYLAIIAAAAAATAIAAPILGERTPRLWLAWMPYRGLNHAQPILLALAVAALHRAPCGRIVLPAALAMAALVPMLGLTLPSPLFARYLAGGEAIAFFLAGAALAAAAPHASIPVAAALAVLAWHRFGAACLALGIAAMWAAQRSAASRTPPRSDTAWLLLLSAAVAAQAAANQAAHRSHLPQTPLDAAIARIGQAGPAVLIAPPETYGLQARTGAAVLVESATASLISYVPALGPAINALYHDLYGIRLDRPPAENPDWRSVWQARTPAEWRALRARYGATHVVAPPGLQLQLPPGDARGDGVCYPIPAP